MSVSASPTCPRTGEIVVVTSQRSAPDATIPARDPRRLFRSPLRGRWLTSVFASVLLVGIPIVIVTGLLSYAAYSPRLGNDQTPDAGLLQFYFFDWPTHPVWLYRVNQGLHVGLGIVLIPIVLAKLWSVMPKLVKLPPFKSPAQLLERLSLVLLVGGIAFEMIIGVLNVQSWYVFGFSFYPAHLYGAWVFLAAFTVHVGIKLPTIISSLRSRDLLTELRTPLSRTEPEEPDEGGLVAPNPARPSLSRRGLLGLVGGSSLLLAVGNIGQTVDALRPLALLSPRGRSYGSGPTDFQINKTASSVGIMPDQVGDAWRLTVNGGAGRTVLTRADLLAMPQHTYDLPIACVEGWSTSQTWTGVRLRDLAARAGVTLDNPGLFVESIQKGGFGSAGLSGDQVADARSLLALRVNGVDLSLDHGYPARVIVPALPGVLNTKWVTRLTFRTDPTDA
jgi:DMSO/TMAO reductase YedYZ molybdopterin-dependent catalytic subunit